MQKIQISTGYVVLRPHVPHSVEVALQKLSLKAAQYTMAAGKDAEGNDTMKPEITGFDLTADLDGKDVLVLGMIKQAFQVEGEKETEQKVDKEWVADMPHADFLLVHEAASEIRKSDAADAKK